jgi:hypothetical protein
MPVSKHKPTTVSPESSTSESASTTIPEQEEFRQHLRRLAVNAVQVLIEAVIGLLDVGSDPIGLGEGLKGIYVFT